LGALSKKYGIGHENAHRALADAVVTKSLYYIYEKVTPDPPFESMDRYIEISTKICDQFKDFIQP
jgi:DNA polymerase III epsilon subunit-like protein